MPFSHVHYHHLRSSKKSRVRLCLRPSDLFYTVKKWAYTECMVGYHTPREFLLSSASYKGTLHAGKHVIWHRQTDLTVQ